MYTVQEIRDIVGLCQLDIPHEQWLLEVRLDGNRPYLQVRVPNGCDADTDVSAFTYPKHTCPHCGKVGGGAQMVANHFDNCKKRLTCN